MSFEAALKERITGDPELAVAGRVVWGRRLTALPGITLQIVVDPRPQHFKGAQRVRPTTVQADAWATSAEAAAALRERLILRLTPSALVGGVQFQRAMVIAVRGGAEPLQAGPAQRLAPEIFRESIDFTFTHNG